MSEGTIVGHRVGGCHEPPIIVMWQQDRKRDRHRARSLLSRASRAARAGKIARSRYLRREAVDLIGAKEVAVICEQERFSFSPTRITESEPPRQRQYGFARI